MSLPRSNLTTPAFCFGPFLVSFRALGPSSATRTTRTELAVDGCCLPSPFYFPFPEIVLPFLADPAPLTRSPSFRSLLSPADTTMRSYPHPPGIFLFFLRYALKRSWSSFGALTDFPLFSFRCVVSLFSAAPFPPPPLDGPLTRTVVRGPLAGSLVSRLSFGSLFLPEAGLIEIFAFFAWPG